MAMTQVRFEGVSVAFGLTEALQNLNLQIEEHEFFAILGPSGCGKTTALRVAAGFVEPSAGRVLFGDADVTHRPANKRNAAMVFQNYALFPHMDVFENVAYGLRARKVDGNSLRRRVVRALERVHLRDLARRPVDELSGGQQQRVALARAIVVEPDVLLLDEPLSNLDAALRESTRDQILEVQREVGITTLYVTHDRDEALALADRMAVFEEGRAVQVGAPPEVYRNPATPFVAKFVSDANLLEGLVEKVSERSLVCSLLGRHQIDLGPPDGREATPGQKVTLAIRPECFRIMRGPADAGLAAKVTRVRFRGGFVEYGIDLFKMNCRLLESAGRTIHAVGDEILLAVDGPQVRFWPEGGGIKS